MPEVQIRKKLISVEEIFHEGGPAARVPLRRAAALVRADLQRHQSRFGDALKVSG